MTKPIPLEVFDELTAETSPGRSKWKTWLDKAGAPEMTDHEARQIIAYTLLDWKQLAKFRSRDVLAPEEQQADILRPANTLEAVFYTVHKWRHAAAYLIPKIQDYWKSRDALTIRLAVQPKDESESDYDIQAELRERLPGLTDEQVTKRRQRLERAQKKNQN